jgi:hypothetical protein
MKSDDERTRSNAITDISFVLEMNLRELPIEEKISRYGSLVEECLININLTEIEEAEILEILQKEIIDSNVETSSLLFAIGKASQKNGLLSLLTIIQNCSSKFNSNESYQALVSLERLLFWNYKLSDEDKMNIVYKQNPISFIKSKLDWALKNKDSPDSSEVQYTAERLLYDLSQLVEKTN